MATARKYELKERAKRQDETRRRITEATVELHGTVGPARTQVSEIARRAGVQRLTVYKHFPTQRELFAACSAHWSAQNPAPDPERWKALDEPETRARTGLAETYAYFRANAAMLENIIRDADTSPELRDAVDAGVVSYLADVCDVVVAGWPLQGRKRERLEAVVGLALQFETWRHLTRARGLADDEAAALMLDVLRCAAAAPG